MELNCNLLKLKPSASIQIMQKAAELKAKGKNIVDLAGGEPDFDTPTRICKAAFDAIKAGHTHYAVGKGLLSLREEIAKKSQEENNICCTFDEIIVTPGGKYGIYLAVAAITNPGDEILILNPSWVSYIPIVEACAGVAIPINLKYEEGYRISEQLIESYITSRTKGIIINFPNNPTGNVLQSEEAEKLRKIVRQYKLFVISDEIYEKIIYSGNRHISLARFPDIRNQVITINGFSKSVAMTGWRLGYTIASKEITDVMYKLYTHTITGTSPFIQEAAVQAFSCGKEIEHMRRLYESRRDYFIKALNEIEGVECRYPQGAFYAWVKFDTVKSSTWLCEQLLEQVGVAGVSGNEYGETQKCCVRFSFANKETEMEEAIGRLRKLKIL